MTTSSEINVLKSLKKLHADSRITKNAHDVASERKKAMRKVLGIITMVLSVFVATGLIELLVSDKSASIIIKLLTFFSAIFAGALTFLNYETEAKTHLSAVGVYANICRSADFLIAKAKDNLLEPEETASKTDVLLEQFSKANLDFQNCIPTEKDFDKARQKMKARDESPRHNMKVKEEPQETSA